MFEEIYENRPDGPIRYGNFISLKHNMTGRYLTSEANRNYDGGSGQQIAFAGGWKATSETTFIVLPCLGEEIDGETDVNFGDVIRLKHYFSGSKLHSHPDIESPITKQQEVTCYGDNDTFDENDEWVVEQWSYDEEENEEFDVEDMSWYTNRSFYLRHLVTGRTLHSHDELLTEDYNEVTGYGAGPDENDRWKVLF